MKNINVFDIVKSYDNDKISSMDNDYLNSFLKYLNEYMLDFRNNLNLSNNVTFGVEVETENIDESKVYNDALKFVNWIYKKDITLKNGIEVVSVDPLIDNLSKWNEFSYVLDSLSKYSEISFNSSAHVHVGAHIIGNDLKYYKNLLKLWAAYEHIIFRFGYGEYLTERPVIFKYAEPLIGLIKYNINLNESLEKFFMYRKKALRFNFSFYKIEKCIKPMIFYTAEARNCNGTLNPIIWQNNVNFFVKLFSYAKSDSFNDELINKRIMNLYNNSLEKNILEYYRGVYVEDAIELADLIFDNNLDKIYFLRQYIKNYEVGKSPLEKGTKFTKCKNY